MKSYISQMEVSLSKLKVPDLHFEDISFSYSEPPNWLLKFHSRLKQVCNFPKVFRMVLRWSLSLGKKTVRNK